ncbi:DUF397 domain-containing protein [Bailinhaonella thermotolerans]|nr:DUF397 domain-containing protein [Bailinhaonella thermotolerans]
MSRWRGRAISSPSRDSKDPGGPAPWFTRDEWAAFRRSVEDGGA